MTDDIAFKTDINSLLNCRPKPMAILPRSIL